MISRNTFGLTDIIFTTFWIASNRLSMRIATDTQNTLAVLKPCPSLRGDEVKAVQCYVHGNGKRRGEVKGHASKSSTNITNQTRDEPKPRNYPCYTDTTFQIGSGVILALSWQQRTTHNRTKLSVSQSIYM